MFETFCPSDKMDEVLENALNWKEVADTLPGEFREQVGRIWQLWTENRRISIPRISCSMMREGSPGSTISIFAEKMCSSITSCVKCTAFPGFVKH